MFLSTAFVFTDLSRSVPKHSDASIAGNAAVVAGADACFREVARMTGRTRTAVARIFTAFRDDNGRIHDAPHDVRPRSTTDEEDRWIVAAAVDQPFITARDIRGELGLNVSDQLVRRVLQKRVLGAMLRARSQF
ncbi:hypothetical protein HPB47_021246 [Ixodes persulcatus]|uniref:Uncharacterized protein n=1 Tax=Ixodes persulcatus TaxID=34615 RepID=A0AC60QGK7_IXOPE|nr:hypothetical protein HPB47_021246 [Ixodes persulcatus]